MQKKYEIPSYPVKVGKKTFTKQDRKKLPAFPCNNCKAVSVITKYINVMYLSNYFFSGILQMTRNLVDTEVHIKNQRKIPHSGRYHFLMTDFIEHKCICISSYIYQSSSVLFITIMPL